MSLWELANEKWDNFRERFAHTAKVMGLTPEEVEDADWQRVYPHLMMMKPMKGILKPDRLDEIFAFAEGFMENKNLRPAYLSLTEAEKGMLWRYVDFFIYVVDECSK